MRARGHTYRGCGLMEHGSGVRKAWTRLRFTYVLVLGLLILSNVSTFMYTSRLLNRGELFWCENFKIMQVDSVKDSYNELQSTQTLTNTNQVRYYGSCKCPTRPCTSSSDDSHYTNMKTVFVITPTFHRYTQKIDLNSMCHTLMSVPKVVWILIEDSEKLTELVSRLIERCNVKIVHLAVPTSSIYKQKKGGPWENKPRGVEQRNAGLHWLRDNYSLDNCSGVFYFGDDDNKYDLRLFEDIRSTRHASVWKVAWAGGLKWEGPTCENGHVTSWHSFYSHRVFPVDMGAFAVDLCELLKRPKAMIGVDINGNPSGNGRLETNFLEHFTNKSAIECRGAENETFAWHSKTYDPNLQFEKKRPSDTSVETD